AAGGAGAQGFSPSAIPARGLRGEFGVFQQPGPKYRPAIRGGAQAGLGGFEATLGMVFAERVTQGLWRQARGAAFSQSQNPIPLQPTYSVDQAVRIVPDHSLGVWNYRVAMPDQISRERFLQTMVQVILAELANRNAREQLAEVPVWLSEGLTRQLLSNQG